LTNTVYAYIYISYILDFSHARCLGYCSGNIVIETKFFDGDLEVSVSNVRVFYIWWTWPWPLWPRWPIWLISVTYLSLLISQWLLVVNCC